MMFSKSFTQVLEEAFKNPHMDNSVSFHMLTMDSLSSQIKDLKLEDYTEYDKVFNRNPGTSMTLNMVQNFSLQQFLPPISEVKLRNYQHYLANAAKEGFNIVICSPTGSGKTLIAADVIKDHLEKNAKHRAVFLVPNNYLTVQQENELRKLLSDQQIIIFDKSKKTNAETLLKARVIITTPQLLINRMDESIDKLMRLNPTDFSLYVLDECHNARGESPYKCLVEDFLLPCYDINKLQQKQQIVGFTASLGTNKSDKLKEAISYLVKACALLLCVRIVTVRNEDEFELKNFVPVSEEEVMTIVNHTPKLSFFKLLSKKMSSVENELQRLLSHKQVINAFNEVKAADNKIPTGLKPFQQYEYTDNRQKHEQWYTIMKDRLVPQMSSNEATESIMQFLCAVKDLAICIELLEHTNTKCAYLHLQKVIKANHSIQMGQSTAQEQLREHFQGIFEFGHHFCFNQSNDGALLKGLRDILIKQTDNASTIVFVRTRALAEVLVEYFSNDPKLSKMRPVKCLGGASDGDSVEERLADMKKFRDHESTLMFATTVAEEGLDIGTCNLVINYNHVTNEIAHVQKKGRTRMDRSRVITLALGYNGNISTIEAKDGTNVARSKLLIEALKHVQMNKNIFENDVRQLIVQRINAGNNKLQKPISNPRMSWFEVRCRHCNGFLCDCNDLYKHGQSAYLLVRSDIWSQVAIDKNSNANLKSMYKEIINGKVLHNHATCLIPLGNAVLIEDINWLQFNPKAIKLVGSDNQIVTPKKWMEIKNLLHNMKEFNTFDAQVNKVRLAVKEMALPPFVNSN